MASKVNNTPNFSIITVCRNERDTIAATCESVVGQTFKGFEWIVVDGRSTDGTLEILAEYRNRICHLISEPDAGIYDAMNKGIRLAAGEYLLFLNGGDYLADSDVLQTAAGCPRHDVLYGDLLCREKNKEYTITLPDVLPRWFLLKKMMPHQATFIRRELFDRYGVYDSTFKIAGDYDLFVRLLYVHNVSYFHIPRILAVFRTDGISCDKSQRMLRKIENHRIRKRYFSLYKYGLQCLKMEYRTRRWYKAKKRGGNAN